jgi:hypothetical protein
MALALVVGLSIPMAMPAMASLATMTVVSDTTVQIIGVYNKAGGVSNYVDLIGSPLSAVRAQEPKPYPTGYVSEGAEVFNSVWDTGVSWSFQTNAPTADWIWETERAEDPALYDIGNSLYDADAARYGRVVLFKKEFTILGNPVSATLHIAADNAYEFWVNSGAHTRSATAKVPGWETSDLWEGKVATTGWQTVGYYNVVADLQSGSNTLYVLAGNEYFYNDDGNSPIPPTQSNPYAQYNPGAVIFQLEIEYEEGGVQEVPGIQLVKTGNDTAHEGDVITYFYKGNNTGEISFWGGNVTIIDSLGITVVPVLESDGNVTGDTDKNGWLDPGEEWLFTSEYTVPCFTAGPVENTGNITATFGDDEEVWAIDDWSVEILHNPDIEVTKTGPTGAYFESVGATYTYEVTNEGDCSLDVTLTDDMVTPEFISGDTNDNGYLDPGETWIYGNTTLLECTGDTVTVFTNKATAVGEDAVGGVVEDSACWNVVVFQWLPRTIGYWGNWDNHWSNDCMTQLVAAVNGNSTYFDGLTPASVKTILLAADQTGKMTVAKAAALLKKQLLATWLNVVSYMGATDGSASTCGSLDAAMDPNALVYFETGGSMTVQALLNRIEYNLTTGAATFGIDGRLKAKDILDKMNNAASNGYYMFMDPAFDPSACPSPG